VISKESTGNGFIIADSTGGPSATVTPGQTITVDKTPIVIQTSSSSTAILLITNPTLTLTIPFTQMPTPMPYAVTSREQFSYPIHNSRPHRDNCGDGYKGDEWEWWRGTVYGE
jgi:hypothetical protein